MTDFVAYPKTPRLFRDVPVTYGVLVEVARERRRQDAKWGEQNHPDGTGNRWITGIGGRMRRAEYRDAIRARCEAAFRQGDGTWRHILDEEIQEAFAELDSAKLRAELIQVAAVACSWVEAIDRRSAQAS